MRALKAELFTQNQELIATDLELRDEIKFWREQAGDSWKQVTEQKRRIKSLATRVEFFRKQCADLIEEIHKVENKSR